MMEIWIRSIARAGGVEIPAAVRVLDESPRADGRRQWGAGLGHGLRRAGNGLLKLAERLEGGPERTMPCT